MGEQTLGVRTHLGLLVSIERVLVFKRPLDLLRWAVGSLQSPQAIRIVDKLVLLHLHAVEPPTADGPAIPLREGVLPLHLPAARRESPRGLPAPGRAASRYRCVPLLQHPGYPRSVPPARFRNRSAAAKARPPALRLSGSPVRCNRGSASRSANLQVCRHPAQSTNVGKTPWTRRPKRRRLADCPGTDVPRTSANRRAHRSSLPGARRDRDRRRPGRE